MKANWKQLWILAIAVPVLAAVGCAGGDIDDADSPHNVLQVSATETPAVTGSRDSTTGACVFTITEWEAKFKNVPKNSLATQSPFNDFFVERFAVSYDWLGAANVTVPPDRDLPAPGTVAPNEEKSIKFEPILLQDFDGDMEGTTGILNMIAVARYADGTRVSIPFQEALVITSCQ